MDRMACVEVPALPLQVLLRRYPHWAGHPVAVVDRDSPRGIILWADATARRRGVVPGMRYAAALSVAGTLLAGEVPPSELRREIEALLVRLGRFSPGVEPSAVEPGVFWLDASGLKRLFPSLAGWAREIRRDLRDLGLRSRVAVGFTRFGTHAAVRSGGAGVVVLRSPGEEAAAAQRVPLERLGIPPDIREALRDLGVRTVGDLLDLPGPALRKRLGPGAHRLHRLASGSLWDPLEPRPPGEPRRRREDLEGPETNVHRLLFRVKRLLAPLLQDMASRRELLAELRLGLQAAGGGGRTETIRPAAPTRDARQIMNLVLLRLEAAGPLAGVEAVNLEAVAVSSVPRQLSLFRERPRRDPEAALRALARIRAELGDEAVVRARIRDAHLPEARFTWEPLERLPRARPREVRARPLVRRILERPVPLPHPPRSGPQGWRPLGGKHGRVMDRAGPYVVSGGWWRREVCREYHFVRLAGGEILWIYRDRARGRWFLQGTVE